MQRSIIEEAFNACVSWQAGLSEGLLFWSRPNKGGHVLAVLSSQGLSFPPLILYEERPPAVPLSQTHTAARNTRSASPYYTLSDNFGTFSRLLSPI